MPKIFALPPLPRVSLVIAGVAIIAALLLQFVFVEQGTAWKAEDGPIEMASALIWAASFLVALVQLARKRTAGWLAGSAMLLWACLRELDLQTAFTYRSVESLGFYTRDIAPLHHKVLAIVILLPFALSGLYLLRIVWRSFWSGELQRARWAGHLLIAAALLVISMASEKLLNWGVMEEVGEFGFALIFFLMTLSFARKGN